MEEERVDLDIRMLELLDLMLEDRQGRRSDKFWKIEITERGIKGKSGDH